MRRDDGRAGVGERVRYIALHADVAECCEAMKFWQSLSFAETDQLIDLARSAEEVGFHGVLLSDHLFFPAELSSKYPYAGDGEPVFGPDTPFPDPWITMAAMAAATVSLRFSSIVYVLPLRHPLEVAKQTATLACISANRFALGVGAGWMKEEFDALGVDFAGRGRRYDEMLQILRSLWTDGEVEFHGEHFDFGPLSMRPVPARPIPIYVGGASGPALRRAARWGDGWIGPGTAPDDVAATLARINELRVRNGRAGEPFENIVPVSVPPDLDTFRRIEDAGATATVAYPFAYTLGARSSLERKRAALEDFAERYIVPLA